MKTKVLVTLVARCEVEFTTTHAPDESPTDLTAVEESVVLADAPSPDWTVERVEVLP